MNNLRPYLSLRHSEYSEHRAQNSHSNTQNNDTQHCNFMHSNTQHNDTKNNNKLDYDNQHNETQHDDNDPNDTQYNTKKCHNQYN